MSNVLPPYCDNCHQECTACTSDPTLLIQYPGQDERAFCWGHDCRCGEARARQRSSQTPPQRRTSPANVPLAQT